MEKPGTRDTWDRCLSVLIGVAILAGLYVTSLTSYQLFHSLAELLSIVIAFGIFVIAWNSRVFLNNNYLLFIGIAYLFIGGIDLIHTLAYKGMGVFKIHDADHPTQLWIAARSLQSLSLLIAPFFVGRRLNPRMVIAAYAGISSLLLWSIFGSDLFPVCYIDGKGLTAFKKNSEYVISSLLVLSGALLFRKKNVFDKKVLSLLLFSIAATVVSELAFTFYVGVYDLSNLVGHLFKILAFYLIYLAIIKTGIRDPFSLIFRSLKQREEELRAMKEGLELRVAERTRELSASTAHLEQEVAERKKAEGSLRRSEERFRMLAENSRDMIYRMSLPDGRYEYVSPASAVLFGYSPDDFYRTPLLVEKVIHPDWHGYFEEQWRKLISGDAPPFYEYQIIDKSGGTRWLYQRNTLIRDADDRPIALQGIVTDITERKLTEEALLKNEQRYRDIFDNVLDGLYLLEVTRDGRFRTLEINPALERSTGIPRAQVIGKTQEEIVPAEVAAIVNAKYQKCVEAGQAIEEEVRLDLPAGTRYFQSTLIPARDAAGRVNRIIGISRDVTERKRSQESLALLNFALNNVREAAFLIDEHAHFCYVNDESCRLLGYTRDDLLKRSVADVDPDFPPERWPEHWTELRKKGSLLFEGRHRARDGRILPVEVSANYFEYAGKGYNLALARDITERKRSEEALRNSESRYRMAQTIGHVGNWEYDLQTTHFWGSDEAKRIYGFERGQPDFTTDDVENCIPERERVHQALVDLIETGKPYNLEFAIIPRNSSEPRTIASIAELQRDEHGNPLRVMGVVQDITERKRSEERLLKLSSAIEQSPVSIVITDATGRIEYVNPKFAQVTGYGPEEVQGKNPRILKSGTTPTEEYKRLWSTITAGNVWNGTFCNRRKNGEFFWERETIAPVKNKAGVITHFIAVKEDITEMRKLEDQLRQAQKMEAIGTLAGGVAHDFNNILTAIIGYGSIVKMKMNPDDPLRESIDQILVSSNRAAHLTQGLLAFSRKQVINPKPIDLNDIMRNVEKLLRRLIGEDVELSVSLPDKNLIAMADAGQIEQVLMNLATNARDAMPEGGALNITSNEVDLKEDFISVHGYGKAGRYALLTVSDTGMGMDEETRTKIFEPFFTTKELGKGTGLGLAIVYGIIKQHNGFINVYSEPGKGTTFKIYLPLIASAIEESHADAAALPRGGRETILLAEDDESVRTLTKSILADFGYRVIDAVDGQDALEKYEANKKDIDILLVDVVMPRKSGKEVYDAVKKEREDIRALFMSGYTADIIHKKGIFEEGLRFVTKPVSPFDLLRKIREILDRGN